MHNYICEECGAYLDPGEKCDCMDREHELRKRKAEAERLAEFEGMWEQQEVVRVSADAYNALVEIYNESTLSMKELASILILESAKRVVYDKEEQ